VSLALRGPRQEQVAITSAQLFVTAWGVSEEYALPIDGDRVRVDLDKTRPGFAAQIADTRGFIYVKADGYSPLMSEAFTWPSPDTPTVIDFRSGRRLTIAPGIQASLDVPMRRSRPRRVRLVDRAGRPLRGAAVEAAAYVPTPNHCGFLSRKDVLASEPTNTAGIIDIPDLDGPYVFSLLERDVLFVDGDEGSAAGFARHGPIVTLRSQETTLRVRRYERRALAVHVVANGKPVSGAVLWSDMELGLCGAGPEPLARADSQGRMRLEPFYPEEWRNVWICAEGRPVWVLPPGGEIPPRIDVGVTRSGKPGDVADVCGR
jgi:hypothetical protein